MKKATLVMSCFLLILICGMIFCGCRHENNPVAAEEENPSWQIVCTDPKEYGISYSIDSIEDLPSYPLDKLIAYRLGSDGACSHNSQHFLNNVLTNAKSYYPEGSKEREVISSIKEEFDEFVEYTQ